MVLTLIYKIASLLLMLIAGAAIVRLGFVKSEDSMLLSKLSIYLFCPCAIFSAMQVDMTEEVLQGFLLATGAAFVMMVLGIVLAEILAKILKLDEVEKLSVGYSNCANLIFPLVATLLGDEWVIYALPYMAVSTIFLWSHAKSVMQGAKGVDLKKAFLNINMISIIIGIIMLVTGVKFPTPINMAMEPLGDFLGPAAMLISGMLLGSMNLKEVAVNKRAWLTNGLRLVLVPLVSCAILRLTMPFLPFANVDSIFTIVLLGASAPTASMVVQMSQVFGRDANKASNINVISIISCILTMPAMVFIFQL